MLLDQQSLMRCRPSSDPADLGDAMQAFRKNRRVEEPFVVIGASTLPPVAAWPLLYDARAIVHCEGRLPASPT